MNHSRHARPPRGTRMAVNFMAMTAGIGLSVGALAGIASADSAPCDKSVSYTATGGVTGDTDVATINVVHNDADNTFTATWPAVDSTKYVFCTATGDEAGVVNGSWVDDNDGTADAQFYQTQPGDTVDNIHVTFQAKSVATPAPTTPVPTVTPTVAPSVTPTVTPTVQPTTPVPPATPVVIDTPETTSNGDVSGRLPTGAGTDLGRYQPTSYSSKLPLFMSGLGVLLLGFGVVRILRSRA